MDICLSKQTKYRLSSQPLDIQCRLFRLDLFTNISSYTKCSYSKKKHDGKQPKRAKSGIQLAKSFKKIQTIQNILINSKLEKKGTIKDGQPKQKIFAPNSNLGLKPKRQQMIKLNKNIENLMLYHGTFGIPKYNQSTVPVRIISRISQIIPMEIKKAHRIPTKYISTEPISKINSEEIREDETNNWRLKQLQSTQFSNKNEKESWRSTRIDSTNFPSPSLSLIPSKNISLKQSLNIMPKSARSKSSRLSHSQQQSVRGNNNSYKVIKTLEQARQALTVVSGDLSHIQSNKDLAISRIQQSTKSILKQSLVIASNVYQKDFWK